MLSLLATEKHLLMDFSKYSASKAYTLQMLVCDYVARNCVCHVVNVLLWQYN